MTRRTKIVATIGPASWDPETLTGMIEAGMDTARVSLSHSSLDDALELIGRIAHLASESGRHIGILADLPGPKIRAATFADGETRLDDGAIVELVSATAADESSTAQRIIIDFPNAAEVLRAGDRVVLGDGAIELTVLGNDGGPVTAKVLNGGFTRGRPGVTIPTEHLDLASPTDSDLVALRALCDAPVEMVAISFVRSAADIERARAVTGRRGPRLIAKLETADAVANVDEIVATADGVMIARGDLGISCAFEDVPHFQKRVIRTGVAYGRPVITATQMLESMVRAPVPTRAEVADVTTAVFDGTSAVMLSGETAVGHDPVNVIKTMDRITRRADAEFDSYQWGLSIGHEQTVAGQDTPITRRITGAISAATWRATLDTPVSAIIACTASGATPKAISRFRPTAPILAATYTDRVARELSVAWGITPMLVEPRSSTDGTVSAAVTEALRNGHIHQGDLVAVMVGAPEAIEPVSDTVRMLRVD
ncbi:MAG: pyruvate kinase [Actinobacteria bacterium]|nr:pyruvate kinase [Actinomycetota bacterium]